MSKISVQVLSDLHTEMAGYGHLDHLDYKTDADVVVIPGDIAKSPDVVKHLTILFPGKLIVFCAGNHEHYNTNLSIDDDHNIIRRHVAQINQMALIDAVFLENDAQIVKIKGHDVKFIGGTLWTDFDLFGKSEIDKIRVQNALNDYRLIQGKNKKCLKPDETLERHYETKNFLRDELNKEFDGPVIVLTHHLPTKRAVHPFYKKDPVSAGFASNLDDLVEKATLWCSGHTHSSSILKMENSLFICNPEGYRRGGFVENKNFNSKLIVDLRRGAPENKWKAGIEKSLKNS